jgi:hypothetical protein
VFNAYVESLDGHFAPIVEESKVGLLESGQQTGVVGFPVLLFGHAIDKRQSRLHMEDEIGLWSLRTERPSAKER